MKLSLLHSLILGACVFSNSPLVSHAQNLILNGDFELGNSLFSSGYTYSPIANSTESQYTVTSDPNSWNHAFAPTANHTPGGTQMLVVNGSTSVTPHVWQQTVSVSPFTTYVFQLYVSTAVASDPAVLRLEINGDVIGTHSAPNEVSTWSLFERSWNSGLASTATLSIFDSNLAVYPNDFYVDDIALTAVPEPSAAALLSLGGMSLLLRRSGLRRKHVGSTSGMALGA